MTDHELKSLLEGMTLEEKVGQLVQCNAGNFISNSMGITGPDGEALPAEEMNRVLGSVLTFENAEQAKALQEKHLAADRNRIPLLLMMDVIHGLRTTYPIPLAMGCGFDDALTYYENLMKHLGWKDRGHVLAGGVMKVGDVSGHKELKEAYELGKAVAKGNGL